MKVFLCNTQLLLIWLKVTGSSTIKTKRNAAFPQRQWLCQRAIVLRYTEAVIHSNISFTEIKRLCKT